MKKNIICAAIMLFFTPALYAAESDTWETEIAIYGWFSRLDGDIKIPGSPGSGTDFYVDASDIIENLSMVFMGGVESKYNKWSILLDVVYMDVGDSVNKTFNLASQANIPVNGNLDLDLSSWVVHSSVGYEVVNTDRITLSVIGGVRYLTIDVDVKTSLKEPITGAGHSHNISDNKGVVDGIAGIRGYIAINENWYIPYHADIGGGGSNLTYQLFTGIGYKFSWGDIKAGYRYLNYDLDEDKFIMQELVMSGPVLGVGFRF